MIPSALHAATTKSLVLAILTKKEESYGYEIIQLVGEISKEPSSGKTGCFIRYCIEWKKKDWFNRGGVVRKRDERENTTALRTKATKRSGK